MGSAVAAQGAAHLEDFLHQPAVVLLQSHLIGLVGIYSDEVGVVLIPLPVADALQEHLDEAQAPVVKGNSQLGPRPIAVAVPAHVTWACSAQA